MKQKDLKIYKNKLLLAPITSKNHSYKKIKKKIRTPKKAVSKLIKLLNLLIEAYFTAKIYNTRGCFVINIEDSKL